VAAGVAAVHCALLFTDRRFAPTAFYQAALNVFTIIAALSLWKLLGVYAFAVGYTLGACAQVGIVCFAARSGLTPRARLAARSTGAKSWPSRLSSWCMPPASDSISRSRAPMPPTPDRACGGARILHARSGRASGAAGESDLQFAAARDRALAEPFAPARAFRLIDRTIALAALAVVAGCAFAIAFREPAIALIFQRGNFTAESTRLVAAVFLGLGRAWSAGP